MPITIEYHEAPKRSVLQHGLIILNGALSLAGQYRSLRFFGVIGLILITLASVWG